MKRKAVAFETALILGLTSLILGATARPASAGLFGPRTVVVMPGYPTYAVAAPVATVQMAPVSTILTSPAPIVDPGLVPTSFTTSTLVTTPVRTTYVAPATVLAPARVRVVYPRRVYRYYGY
jgi:hypothetical protein